MIAYYVVHGKNLIDLQMKVVEFIAQNQYDNWEMAGGVAYDGQEYLQALVDYHNPSISNEKSDAASPMGPMP